MNQIDFERELLERIEKAYPGDLFYNRKTLKPLPDNGADTLGLFILREVHSVIEWNMAPGEDVQDSEVLRALIADAFNRAAHELMAARDAITGGK